MWKYESPIGTMFIQQLSSGSYALLYNNTIWEASGSPQAEADNVYRHKTGCRAWDSLEGEVTNVPADLSKWESI